MIGIKPLDFQESCSEYLKDYCLDSNNKKVLVVKAPTGAGKTIILLDFIDRLNAEKSDKIAYIWLTPGSGELEEQSKAQMERRLPQYKTKTLDDALRHGFEDKDVCFINWERVTKKGNKAIIESERKNLFEQIAEAHRSNLNFLLIVDEEHSNNTDKAKTIIHAFAPCYTVRVSATAKQNRQYDYYEIDEAQVIESGLITRAIYINEGIDQQHITDENGLLLQLANDKRKAIKAEYDKLEIKINPLVLIQFPNEKDELIKLIEQKLEALDVTYNNGKLAIWMSNCKENLDGITERNGHVQFLLMKQAISTGWDCPRAKILVKLRERMSEDFEIQTLGRLRRMPDARHYDNELMDNAYLYTFDEKYKQAVTASIGNAYEVRRIFLKKEYNEYKFTKQGRDEDFASFGEQEIRDIILSFYKDRYGLSSNRNKNLIALETNGYNISHEIESSFVQAKVIRTEDMVAENIARYHASFKVNTHEHGISLRQTIDSFKNIIGLSYNKTRVILEMMFRGVRPFKHKFLDLNTEDFYAFIINNRHKIHDDLRDAMYNVRNIGKALQTELESDFPKTKEEDFYFPREEVFKYTWQKDPALIENNVYNEYTDDCLVEGIRSCSERLFERYCEKRVKWYYKNGDTGPQYLSIVYTVPGNNRQRLFYPDYILKVDKDIWIIETKGGENADGTSKNIDEAIEVKFEALKAYAEKYNLKWGFVRDKYDKLYINNTEYQESLDGDQWKPIDTAF